MRLHCVHAFSIFTLLAFLLQFSSAQLQYDTLLYNKMQWREIGPFRGGRSVAVAGHKDQPSTFAFGATGGGIWKTEDAGNTWLNVSDGYSKEKTETAPGFLLEPSDRRYSRRCC